MVDREGATGRARTEEMAAAMTEELTAAITAAIAEGRQQQRRRPWRWEASRAMAEARAAARAERQQQRRRRPWRANRAYMRQAPHQQAV